MPATTLRDYDLVVPGHDRRPVTIMQVRHVDLTDDEPEPDGEPDGSCWCDAGPMTACWCDAWWVHVDREHGDDVAVGPYDDEERAALRSLDHGTVVAALRERDGVAVRLAHGEPDPDRAVIHPDGTPHADIAPWPCG